MKTILCYGDSNTYGLKSDLVSRYPRNVRWTGILQEKLGSEYYAVSYTHLYFEMEILNKNK